MRLDVIINKQANYYILDGIRYRTNAGSFM